MLIRLLGSLEIVGDDERVRTLDGPRPRGLLCLLALRPNQPVSADQLADELWQEQPPKSAAAALRVHVAAVRKALEPDRTRGSASAWLTTDSLGYRLSVGPAQIDTLHFEDAVTTARGLAADGAANAALAEYEVALELWRGPAFEDTRELAAVAREATRLDAMRAAATDDLAGLLLRTGAPERAAELLHVAVATFPLHEQLVRHLMVALYRTGRQADALDEFIRLATHLDEELGIGPTAELRAVEEAVLLQDPSLDWTPPPASTARTAPDHGSRRVIGRRAELADLGELLDDHTRAPRVALVTGPAGIGKSTLVERFCADAERRDVPVVVGRCDPDAASPYQPFIDVLTALSTDPGPDALELDDDLAMLALSDSSRSGEVPTLLDRAGAFESIAEALARVTAPLLVIMLEDTQWIGRPSFALIRHLLRHPALGALRIVMTLRDDDLAPHDDLTAMFDRLRAEPDTRVIALGGLDPQETLALLRAAAPTREIEALITEADRVYDVTQGNPFFIRELLRDIVESSEPIDDVRVAIAQAAPSGVRAVVQRRARRVSDECHRLLETAAVAGHLLELDVLVEATATSELTVLDALDEALDAQLVLPPRPPDAQYTFTHALIRNAVYEDIDPAARSELHGTIADALVTCRSMELENHAAAIARHYLAGPRAQYGPQALEAARSAAEQAMRQYAFEDATDWYRRVVDLEHELVPGEVDARTWFDLGRALTAVGKLDDGRAVFRDAASTARASGDHDLFADIALANLGDTTVPYFTPEQIDLLDDALALSTDDARRVLLLCAKASTLYFTSPDEEARYSDEAMSAARTSGGATMTIALASKHRSLLHDPERLDERLAIARSVHETCHGLPETFSLQRQRDLLVDLLQAGQRAEFADCLLDYESRAVHTRNSLGRYNAMALRATEAASAGELMRAEQLADGAKILGERLDVPDPLGAHMLHLFTIRYQQGRLTELPPAKQRAAAPTRTTPAGYALAAVALAETEHAEHVLPIVDSLLPGGRNELPRDSFWLGAMALLSSAVASSDAGARAHGLRAALDPCRGQVVVFGAGGAVLGLVDQWIGQLALATDDLEGAIVLLEASAARCDELAMPYWSAHARANLAVALGRRGAASDAAAAAQLVSEVTDVSLAAGFGRLIRHLHSGAPGA